MERKELNVNKREIGKSASKKIRKENRVPAILYGVGRDPQPLSVNMKEVDKVVSTEAGWNILLDLNIDGKDKVLSRISDYQADVLRRHLTHIDFQVLDLKKKIKTEVPIKLIGKAVGVKEGGIMEVIRRSLEVKCLPTEIPEHIDIDVTAMVIGDSVHIEDVTMPSGVECLYDTNFSIAAVVSPTLEIIPEVPEEEVPAELAEGEEAPPAEGEEAKAAAPAEGKEGKEGAAPQAGKAEKKAEKKGDKKE